MIGAEAITGPTIAQACATGARTVASAAAEVDATGEHTVLAVTADRCSNGAHVYYPNPQGPGGMGDKEDIVMDSFGHDPWARNSMIQTAENVAAEAGITRERQDECTLVRYQQYQQALASTARFRSATCSSRSSEGCIGAQDRGDGDQRRGVFATTKDGLGGVEARDAGGTVTVREPDPPATGIAG
jgi:acetyl-CoA acetyltransferase